MRTNDYIQKVNKHVGKTISELRLNCGMNQRTLSSLLNVSQQQLQKYENGINRICLARILEIIKIFDVDINLFFPPFYYDQFKKIEKTERQGLCLELTKNFMKIKSLETQKMMVNLTKTLTKK